MTMDNLPTRKTIVNPFLKTQINNAWDISGEMDVKKIHENLTVQIIDTLTQIREYGSILQVLVGAPGSGKTHLLSRLWQLSVQERKFLLVAIPPPGDITRVNLHILREIITSLLTNPDQNQMSPMDLLITEIMRNVLVQTLPVDQNELKNQVKISKSEALFRLLTSEHRNALINVSISKFSVIYPDTDIQLGQVLFSLLDPFKMPYALKWFQGGDLTEQEAANLGLRSGSNIINEDLALNMAKSLIKISPYPILFAVDQLESTNYRFQKEGLLKLIDTVITLLQEENNLLLLLVAQTQEWIETIRPNLPRYILDRISKLIPLKPLTMNETYALVKLRLEKFHLATESIFLNQKPFFPFSDNFINNIYGETGGNPRQFLNLLRNSFDFSLEFEFAPHWELEYHKLQLDEKEIVKTPEIIFQEVNQIFKNKLLDFKPQTIELIEQTHPEKLRELFKGYIAQIIKEIQSIMLFKTAEESTVQLNVSVENLIIDLIINKTALWNYNIGILIINQKNNTWIHEIVNGVEIGFKNGLFDKIIILRSDNVSSFDLPIKTHISSLENQMNVEFQYVSDLAQSDLLLAKRLLDDARDFNFDDLATSPQLVSWLIIYNFALKNEIFQLILSFSNINQQEIIERAEKRIFRLILESSQNQQHSENEWFHNFNFVELPLITFEPQNLSNIILFFALEIDEELYWGIFVGPAYITINDLLWEVHKQSKVNFDPLSTFLLTRIEDDITHLLDTSVGEIIAEFGQGLLMSQNRKASYDLKGAMLKLFSLIKDMFSQIPPQESFTAQKLSVDSPIGQITPEIIANIARIMGGYFNVRLNNELIVSTQEIDQLESHAQEKPEDSTASNSSQAILDDNLQKVWDDNVIELTNRITKFNLKIDPKDYEVLSAILTHAEITPNNLNNLVKGLAKKQLTGDSNKLKKSHILYLTEVEVQILSNYEPYKSLWDNLSRLPSKLGTMGRHNLLQSFRLNALTLLDFDSIIIQPQWHSIIAKSTKNFVKTILATQQLSASYFERRFEANALKPLVPLVNRYQTLVVNEVTRIRNEKDDRDKILSFTRLTQHIVDWWKILDTFNHVVGRSYHLENIDLLESLFFDYSNELVNEKINFTTSDPLTFTMLFEDAFRLLGGRKDLKINITQLRSKQAEIQSETYFKLATQMGGSNDNFKVQETYFWGFFYASHLKSPEWPFEYLKTLLETYSISDHDETSQIMYQLFILVISLTYQAEKDLDFRYTILQIFAQIYHDFTFKKISTKQENIINNLFDFLLLHAGYDVEKVSPELLNSKNIPNLLNKIIKPYLNRPFTTMERTRVKFIEEIRESYGCNLSFNDLLKTLEQALNRTGLLIKEDKSIGSKKIRIYSGITQTEIRLELIVEITPKDAKTILTLTYRWNKGYTQIEQLSSFLTSYMICSIITHPKYREIDDRAFIIKCIACDFQINILKANAKPYLFYCKHCNIDVLVHPIIYKPARSFMKM